MRFELEFADDFDGDTLDLDRWLPYYLPQWSSRAATAARYRLKDGFLHLRVDPDQAPWCPEWDGDVRASSLQTGVHSGPVGSTIGQLQFRPGLVVREEQAEQRLYTPHYGRFELRAKALTDPRSMVALWMIGFEDRPERSAEICVCEIFGRDVTPTRALVGMGVHPFGDPSIVDDFVQAPVDIDAREFHEYAAEWTPDGVSFYVDGGLVRSVDQSPNYPMQVMLSVYQFSGGEPAGEFTVDYFRGYRLVDLRSGSPEAR